MCEKAARIAELEREIADARIRLACCECGAERHCDECLADEEIITEHEAELARLRNEPPPGFGQADKDHPLIRALNGLAPALTQEEGSEPVGWRCFHCGEQFDNIECAQTHFGSDESRDPGCIEKLKGGELGLLRRVRQLEEQLVPYLNESSAVENYVCGLKSEHNQAITRAEEEGYAKGLRDAKLYPDELAASPPPLPAGNADPRVREALEFGFASYQDGSFELIAKTAEGNEVTLKGKLEEQQLEEIDKIFPTCVFVKYGINPLPSPQSQGLVEAAEFLARLADAYDANDDLTALHYRDQGHKPPQRTPDHHYCNQQITLGFCRRVREALRSRASDRSA